MRPTRRTSQRGPYGPLFSCGLGAGGRGHLQKPDGTVLREINVVREKEGGPFQGMTG